MVEECSAEVRLIPSLLLRANLLSACGVVFSLLVQDLFSVLEVTETANFGTTGFAAPTEAVPGSLSAMVLGQGFARVAVCAGLRLQDSGDTSLSIAALPSQEI